MVNFSPSYTVQ
jgi:hypothetical protein